MVKIKIEYDLMDLSEVKEQLKSIIDFISSDDVFYIDETDISIIDEVMKIEYITL